MSYDTLYKAVSYNLCSHKLVGFLFKFKFHVPWINLAVWFVLKFSHSLIRLRSSTHWAFFTSCRFPVMWIMSFRVFICIEFLNFQVFTSLEWYKNEWLVPSLVHFLSIFHIQLAWIHIQSCDSSNLSSLDIIDIPTLYIKIKHNQSNPSCNVCKDRRLRLKYDYNSYTLLSQQNWWFKECRSLNPILEPNLMYTLTMRAIHLLLILKPHWSFVLSF